MDLSAVNFDREKYLLGRFQAGSVDAFTEIYNLYWKKLFFVAASKLQNPAEAEEAVQDIFLDIWRRRTELNITTSLSCYLSACVKYKVINVLSKRYQQMLYVQSQASGVDGAECSVEDRLQYLQLKNELSKETAKLPEKCRLVFQLSREKGYSHKNIATLLGIAEKTVESHLTKALRTLRASLSHISPVLFLFFHSVNLFF